MDVWPGCINLVPIYIGRQTRHAAADSTRTVILTSAPAVRHWRTKPGAAGTNMVLSRVTEMRRILSTWQDPTLRPHARTGRWFARTATKALICNRTGPFESDGDKAFQPK